MEMRQRRPTEPTSVGDFEEEVLNKEDGKDGKFVFRLPSSAGGFPSPEELVEQHPGCKHGFLSKRNTSMAAQLMPCCSRKWKTRYFCLVGGYLYRFSSFPEGAIKGVPIPLEACLIRLLEEGDIDLEPGEVHGACFELSMIRKQYIFKASSTSEAAEWVAALRARKMQSIKESLGHAPVSPAVRALNAKSAQKFKQRIDQDRTEGDERLKEFNRQSAQLNPMFAGASGRS